MLERIVCLAVGYVLGLFQTSYIYGRKQGIDIREHGSGNAGTTNAFRTMGEKSWCFDSSGRYTEMWCWPWSLQDCFSAAAMEIIYVSWSSMQEPDVSLAITFLFT